MSQQTEAIGANSELSSLDPNGGMAPAKLSSDLHTVTGQADSDKEM